MKEERLTGAKGEDAYEERETPVYVVYFKDEDGNVVRAVGFAPEALELARELAKKYGGEVWEVYTGSF
ncbi:hypothetical protein FJNA_24280 [Thermus sp. FJN-A]